MQLFSVLRWEGQIGEHIRLGLAREDRKLEQLAAALVVDLAPLRLGCLRIVLNKRGGDGRRRRHAARSCRHAPVH